MPCSPLSEGSPVSTPKPRRAGRYFVTFTVSGALLVVPAAFANFTV